MELLKLGEFGLIAAIRGQIHGKQCREGVLAGIGDDAAVLKLSEGKLLVAAADTLVEKVHFDLSYYSYFDLGWKSLAVNLSDIAAMGADPKWALVSIGLPKRTKVKNVIRFYKGMKALGGKYGVSIVGGDTVSSPNRLYVSITLLGEVLRKRMVLRKGAKEGDLILATGSLGGALPGRNIKHLRPEPRVREGRIIANGGATSMIDSSDGLSRSLAELCKASGKGALLFEGLIPRAKKASLKEALHGGEDYELVFTCPKRRAGAIIKELAKLSKASVIGRMTNNKGRVVLSCAGGKEKELEIRSFEHF
ncbi:MAG: thiamine-phosphate kinase [Candidatus Margulisiibacteriota bacterium]